MIQVQSPAGLTLPLGPTSLDVNRPFSGWLSIEKYLAKHSNILRKKGDPLPFFYHNPFIENFSRVKRNQRILFNLEKHSL